MPNPKSEIKENDDHLNEHDFNWGVREQIRVANDNPDREGLRNTPQRIYKLYSRFFNPTMPTLTRFTHDDGDEVIVRVCDFVSFCEHHLVPFSGHAYIGYLPRKKVLGLRKIDQVVDFWSRRLQLQERLTAQIGNTLFGALKPRGLMVVVKAQHFCAILNGDQGEFITSKAYGCYRNDISLKTETMTLMGL